MPTTKTSTKLQALEDFRQIPGVGLSVAEDFWNLGFRSVTELKDQDPEELCLRLCDYQRIRVDRCMLYVFRCAVYYASNETHDPDRLKWWNWKD